MVDVPTSPERKCNIHVYDTALQPIYPRDIILASLVLVHAGYLFCNWHPLNTNYYRTPFGWMPGSFNSSQPVEISVLGPRFIVSSEGLGLHNCCPKVDPATAACWASSVPLDYYIALHGWYHPDLWILKAFNDLDGLYIVLNTDTVTCIPLHNYFYLSLHCWLCPVLDVMTS